MKRYILTIVMILAAVYAVADNALHRYVSTTGAYTNNGMTWATAKNNVQDAINDLHDYMLREGISAGGYVFVAEGTYRPTESTETTGGTTQNMAFKMYAGITVSGGWIGTEAVSESGAGRESVANDNGTRILSHKTIFSGNLVEGKEATFTWNEAKQYYTTAFPSNVYHVVWFATNGFDSDNHARALTEQSVLDGITIEGGRAHNTDLVGHPHNAYGAGIYMVKGACVRNCEVMNCEASRDGAGIYLDGGGDVYMTYIHGCQTLGLGIQYGRGGAVCIDNGGTVEYCYAVNNVAREGAGLAIHTKGICKATLIANNTATTEAGGAYLNGGGVLNNVSVYRNRCNGQGAVIGGIATGQSAGIFAVGPAKIYNSSLWGGIVGDDSSNEYDDLQFSAYEKNGKAALHYVAMNNSDRVNWSNATTNGLVNLATQCTVKGGYTALNYINLKKVADKAGVITEHSADYVTQFDFRPNYISAIVNAGVLLDDMPADRKEGTEGAETDTDALGSKFSPLCDLGANMAIEQSISHATGIAMVDATGEETATMTLFVDPNRSTSLPCYDASGNVLSVGASWERPLQNLRDALNYMSEHKTEYGISHWQILCKKGTLHTAGTNTPERLVSSSIYMVDGVHVFGGYPSALTGTSLVAGSNGNIRRDPTLYPTVISGSLFEDEYAQNAAHLVNFSNVSNAVLDGFQLRYGNASASVDNGAAANAVDWGAGILVTNMFEYQGKETGLGLASNPGNMTGNAVRNTLITGCTARSGSALYTHCVNAMSEFELVNCIIHNNGTINGTEAEVPIGETNKDRSTIHVGSAVTLNVSHCDILRNVGCGINAASGSTLNIDNSIIYANLNKTVDNTDNWISQSGVKLCTPLSGEGTIKGEYNLFDSFHNAWTALPAEALGSATLTYSQTDNASFTYPQFKNPTKNSGVSPEGDVTFYGNATDFMPSPMNPAVNAADPANATTLDMAFVIRGYGNLPDIGAIENTDQPNSSFGYYVRDYGSDLSKTNTDGSLRDGMSWNNAINGNAVYLTQTSGDGAIIGYKMKNRSTGRYISTTKVNNAANHPTLQMTEDVNAAETFTLPSNIASGSGTIYAQTVGMYFNKGTSGGTVWMWLYSGGTTCWIWQNGNDGNGTNYYSMTCGGSYFVVDDNATTPLMAYSAGSMASTNSITQWELIPVYNTSETNIYGLQYAIDNAANAYTTDSNKREIWVGAGIYSHGIEMRNGVDVLGGFLGVGNPTKRNTERDLSNDIPAYKTVVDAGQVTSMTADSNGYLTATFKTAATEERVLTTSDFTVETMIEGVTLKGGYTTNSIGGAGAYLCQNTLMKNCLVTGNYANGANGGCGAGIYMTSNATVKNSIIKQNLLENVAHTKGGAGLYISDTGNKLINSLIVENVASTPNAVNILGAAVVCLKSGSFYNCTIAYNIGLQKNHNGAATGGFWDQEKNSLFINCILWGNYATGNTYENFFQVGMPGFSYGQGLDQSKFKNCYHSTFSESTACTLSTEPNYSELVWLSNQGAGSQSGTQSSTALTTLLTNVTNFAVATKENSPFNPDYSLKSPIASISTNCINKAGDGSVLTALNIYEDITGADRVQDCALDKGAYEYNGAADIYPTFDSETSTAVFYVTEVGNGTASAENAQNAACWQKIQKVLDAAGRYKYNYPTSTVKVCLAGNAGGVKYSPRRTVDPSEEENDRSWSLMVPNGVEVYGGYNNDFTEEQRSVTTNKTYLDGIYKTQNVPEGTHAYHVVTFTDRVYDIEGLPYMAVDEEVVANSGLSTYSYDGNVVDESSLMSLSAKFKASSVSTAAILDGLFITNGQADGTESVTSTSKNYRCYGGAAIVPEYAQIQNCIVSNNKATTGGGAFLLQKGSFVTGTLLKNNSAKYGGAIYFEEWTPDSWIDEATNNTGNPGALTIYQLAQIYTSTIVKNTATIKGGGIYFDNNARVNSSVVWGNTCGDQANVAGQTAAFSFAEPTATTYESFPFAYSAVENNRLPGANNLSVATDNRHGVRFGSANDVTKVAEDASDIDEYYPLTDYSVLAKRGMSKNSYSLMAYMGTPKSDFMTIDRIMEGYNYIDIGARAYFQPKPTFDLAKVLLRLYVTQPEDVDMIAKDVMSSQTVDAQPIYSQKGSSFAYPMQSLDEALEYIRNARSRTLNPDNCEKAANLPFEIILSRGTYYPARDIYNVQGQSFGNTFLVPEGVTIVGGFNSNVFYGQVISSDNEGTVSDIQETSVRIGDYTINQISNDNSSAELTTMKNCREHADNNANDIIEPWEFKYQTVLSGKVINSETDDHVYHVVSAIADENLVGVLPDTGSAYITEDGATKGSMAAVKGKKIELNGLQITDGQALKYHAIASKGFMAMDYYHGGGVMIDGNWGTCKTKEGTVDKYVPTYYKLGESNATGTRNIPLVIDRCSFIANEAGWGGALSSNGEVSVYNSAFSGNIARAGVETVEYDTDGDTSTEGTTTSINSYAGNGGAVYCTNLFTAVNTLFQNNEASVENVGTEPAVFSTVRNQAEKFIYPGCGGVIYSGAHGQVQLTNCNFVRNKANMFPAVFSRNPNTYRHGISTKQAPQNGLYNKITNCVFWGNIGTNSSHSYAANLIMSYCPVDQELTAVPTSQQMAYSLLPADQMTIDTYAPALWFCAFEQNTGQTPVNTLDVRRATTDLANEKFITVSLKDYATSANGLNMTEADYLSAGGGEYQDANVLIDSDNAAIDGPNFNNPSHVAGADGYMQDADWMPSRMNKLTDAGWGYIEQATDNLSDVHDVADGVRFVMDEDGVTTKSQGAFPEIWKYNKDKFSLGYDTYMQLLKNSNGEPQTILRISKVPIPTVADLYAYIDLGVYEYQHQKLGGSDGEVDYLWVSPKEKLENGPADGKSWKTPTSDLQRAIETLLSNRNGHDKTIYMIEGEYKPIYTFRFADEDKTKNFAFTVNTTVLNKQASAPSRLGESSKANECVKSLNILGGFSSELESVVAYDTDATDASALASRKYSLTLSNRDTERYPSVITTDNSDSRILFHIEDARQWYGVGDETSGLGNASTLNNGGSTVIPISINGVTFLNRFAPDNNQNYAGELHYAAQPYNASEMAGVACLAPESENKLTVSNCIFRENGVPTATQLPAVTVVADANYPGKNLIYNSLFHSNNGRSLYADRTKVVNCTFANNRGGMYLTSSGAGDAKSALHASLLWNNGAVEVLGLSPGTMTYNAISNFGDDDAYHNTSLAGDNRDVLNGPNFANPDNDDYHLLPSMKTLDVISSSADFGYDAFTDGEKDLAYASRVVNHKLDRGAYEYQNQLRRVIYYDPKAVTNSDGTGWDKPFSKGHLQDAIDLAAMYSASVVSESEANKLSYVFAKASDIHTEETITPRSGVMMYGSIPASYLTSLSLESVTEDAALSSQSNTIGEYVTALCQDIRPGLLVPLASRTVIDGVNASGIFDKTTVIDGFHVKPVMTAEKPVTLYADAADNRISLVNSLIEGDAEVTGGLLYNSLVLGNVTLSTNGYAANVTASGTITSGNSKNCIAEYNGGSYQNAEMQLLKYQLDETDSNIDAGTVLPDVYSSFGAIHYALDRDVLGNPRLLGSKVDNGAFETWRVSGVTIACYDVSSTDKPWRYFPHDGSNVYLMQGSSLVLDTSLSNYPLIPRYLLVKEGASLFGQGNKVNVSYLSVERTVGKDGNIMSLPFYHEYSGGGLYKYNGDKRSAYDYDFANTTSPCWEEVETGIDANTGILYVPDTADWTDEEMVNGKTMRFTSCGTTTNDYVYSENANSKVVTIYQYDDFESTNGEADFTSKEKMGWNCIGIPYLVSDYKPYLGADGNAHTSGEYMMNVPHELWLYYNGETYSDGSTLVDGDGGFYSVQSWDGSEWHVPDSDHARLWVGEGIFMQTAAVSGHESVVFHRPVYLTPASAPVNKRYYVTDLLAPDNANESASSQEGCYDLQGRRIDKSHLGRGVYIVNGRKVVVTSHR